MQAIVKYIHGVSTCHRDLAGPFDITAADLVSAEAARAWLKRNTKTSVPLRDARHEDGGWVFFPLRKRGSIWWSVSVRLDIASVKVQAATCRCSRGAHAKAAEGEHTYTTAPEEYDGFGTELIAEIGRMKKGGTTVRLVATPAEHLDWQRNRYYSGGIYFVGDFAAWKTLLGAGIAEH